MPILRWYAGDGGEGKITNWHRSSCIYDFLRAPLLSLHNQLHRGRNNWFSVYANAMDLERGQANTQPCCLSGMTFKMEWRVLDSGQIAGCFCCCSNDSSRKSCQVALVQNRAGNQTSDVFCLHLFRELYYYVSTDGGKLDCTHACRALAINPPTN